MSRASYIAQQLKPHQLEAIRTAQWSSGGVAKPSGHRIRRGSASPGLRELQIIERQGTLLTRLGLELRELLIRKQGGSTSDRAAEIVRLDRLPADLRCQVERDELELEEAERRISG